MNNYLQKAYCMNQTVRIYAAITTDMISSVKETFNLWPSSLMIYGKSLIMASIMSCTYKNNDILNIYVKGDGPVGKVTIEGIDGVVRGYVENPGVYLQYNDGSINTVDALGNGSIEVVKDLHMRIPFSSASEIVSGDMAENFSYYFAKSEQIPSAVSLGIKMDKDFNIIASGGFLIQVMPGCKEETIARLEAKLKTLKPIANMINEGMNTEQIISEITDGDYEILETKELKYECRCSKEGFKRGIKSLGYTEVEDILLKDKKAEVCCHFCNKKYLFDENDLKEILFELDKNSTKN